MATNQTEHYKLNQWELSDSVIMAEFNADNTKIEQALLELKAALPKFQSGSYVGTGTCGAESPTSLTFDFEPKLVILTQESLRASNVAPTPCIRGITSMVVAADSEHYNEFHPELLNMIWNDRTFSWYGSTPYLQFNAKDATYHYMAIG